MEIIQPSYTQKTIFYNFVVKLRLPLVFSSLKEYEKIAALINIKPSLHSLQGESSIDKLPNPQKSGGNSVVLLKLPTSCFLKSFLVVMRLS